jgi:predicted nucleotidyltransferase
MSFFDASTAGDLEPAAAVLAELSRRTADCGVDMMVVGAVARDILIRHVVGSDPERATKDIDVAIAVSSWAQFACVTSGLVSSRAAQRFLVLGVEVDIIPFGEIETAERTINWPDEHSMNVIGFSEAFSAAAKVLLPGGLTVSVASLAAQSVLKLFAWRDRRHESPRDAIDLRAILRAYSEGPYLEELYKADDPLLTSYDFDVRLAGAGRLGREAQQLIGQVGRKILTDMLSSDSELMDLVAAMRGDISANRTLLLAYRAGLTEASGPDNP